MLNKYKDFISESRWNEICDVVKAKQMSISFRDFTNSEIELIISESNLTENKEKGAKMFFIKRKSIAFLASHFGYSEATIKYYRRKISKALKTTCCRIFQ